MSKLPSIFHNNNNLTSNNKNSFNTFTKSKKEVKDNSISIDKDNLINYFNKRVVVGLKSGNEIEGVLISKRNDKILLDTKDYINIKDILYIK